MRRNALEKRKLRVITGRQISTLELIAAGDPKHLNVVVGKIEV